MFFITDSKKEKEEWINSIGRSIVHLSRSVTDSRGGSLDFRSTPVTLQTPAYSCSSRCVSRPAFHGSDLHPLEVSALAELEPTHFQTKQLELSILTREPRLLLSAG
ncbi:hypothetical protein MLD38_029736 [Melastoma candidum]|uniref:Uncharacterized protein n=1 Tax=Melastoma candidum TaxID=119954 RepID=A0ACB9N4M5_9MYRT|nr:hypothetical protein MLD38_029736 [Melastoma candidum]